MTISSANPDNLNDYDDGASSQISALDELRQDLHLKQNSVVEGSPSAGIQPRALHVLHALLTDGINTATWVGAVRDALIQADNYDHRGIATLTDRALADAIGEGPPAVQAYEIQPLAFTGVPQTSGYVDDPVNAWTGNFVHGELDLRLHGASSPASVRRMYNSAAGFQPGVFGPGWTSMLDMAVTGHALDGQPTDEVIVRLADGAHLPFSSPADDTTEYRCDWRRHLRLMRTPEGWLLDDGTATSWSFDADGRLTGGTGQGHDLVVTHDDGHVTVSDELTGRSVTYQLAGDLVRSAWTDDGRRADYDHDAAGRLIGVRTPAGGHTYGLDDLGRILTIVDADGVALVHNTFDHDGRVIGQTSQHGRTTTYSYTDQGVTTVADVEADGGRNILVHDRRGNLLAVFDGEGHAVRRTYDARDRITAVTDRRGNLTTYQWDDDDRLITRQTADGGQTRWEHDDRGRVTTVIDPGGVRTDLAYQGVFDIPVRATTPAGQVVIDLDDQGRPVEITDPDAVSCRLTWTTDSLIDTMADAEGRVTTYGYDATGRLQSVREPDGSVAQIEIDAAGRTTAVHGPDGFERLTHTDGGRISQILLASGERIALEHDGRGRLHRVVRDAGMATFMHDRFGNLVEAHDPLGGVQRTAYDLVGRVTQTVDRAGHTTAIVYDPDGNAIQIHTPDGRSVSRTVDLHGRTTSMTAPDGAVETRTYHPGGQLASVTDALGNMTTFQVDDAGRTVAKVDALGRTTRWNLTPAGRIHSVEHPGGMVQLASHDANGLLTAVIGPDGTSIAPPAPWGASHALTGLGRDADDSDAHAPRPMATYGLDSRGLLAQVTDPAGITTELTRDLLGRITATRTVDAGFDLTRSPEGWLVGTTDAMGRRSVVEHDEVGRPLAVTRADGTGRRHVLDPAGRVVQVLSSSGALLAEQHLDALGQLLGGAAHGEGEPVVLDRRLDALGRIVASTDASGTTTYDYDEVGRLGRRTDPDGISTTLVRGPEGSITAHVVEGESWIREVGAPQADTRTRDALGRVTVDHAGRSFTYDRAGRLTSAVLPDGRTSEWAYDDLGRLHVERRSVADRPAQTLPQGFTPGTRRYDHDLSGRLTAVHDTDGTTQIIHDPAGRRTEERRADGSVRRFTFNDLDRLVLITVTTPDGIQSTRSIAWDVLGRPVRVDDTDIGYDDAITGKPIRVGDRRYLRQGGQVRQVPATADGSGDVSGTVGGSWDDGLGEDPWGRDRAGDGIDIGYRGELVVDGLVLMGARVYDPATRCFLSIDPLSAVPGRLCYAAPYAYAEHDPINMVDPTGLRPLSEDEMRDYLIAAERNIFEAAGHAIAEDPWGFVTAAAVIAVGGALVIFSGGALLPLVGAGILAGGAGAVITGVATRSLDADSVVFGSVAGGVAGPIMGPLSGWTAVGAEAGFSVPVNVIDHTLVQGQPLSEISPTTLVVGAVASGGIRGFGEFGPRGAGPDVPAGPRPAPPITTSMGSEFGDAPLRMVDAPPAAPRPAIPATGSRVTTDLPVFGPPSAPTMTPLPGTIWSTPTGAIELPSGLLTPPSGLLVPTPSAGSVLPSGLWVPGDPG